MKTLLLEYGSVGENDAVEVICKHDGTYYNTS